VIRVSNRSQRRCGFNYAAEILKVIRVAARRQGENPDELTQVSDSGERPQPTPLRL